MAASTDNVAIGPVRITFPRVFEQDNKGKYSLTLLIPKTEEGKKIARVLHNLAKKAVELKWPDEAKRPRKLTLPVKDGDSGDDTNDGIPKGEKYEEYAGHYYVSAASNRQPGVVDQKLQRVLDPDKIYSGVWVNLQVNAYAYDNEKKGASIGLQNIQLHHDDERFGGGGPKAEDAFGAIDLGGDSPFSSEDDGDF